MWYERYPVAVLMSGELNHSVREGAFSCSLSTVTGAEGGLD